MSETELRDHLAVERTHLSNERTLLSYIRTALSLIISAGVVLQFLREHPVLTALAWLAILGGVLIGVIGAYRFFKVRSQIPRARG
ncbi:YidH family protein [Marinimicrobium sp. ARAG 43.8]|uniref:YidH family protein n=1 Tax=Marinimicrobium sp. ARAG 43.8 TaxID=3418719 RepID=UPI003CF04AD9